MTCSHIASTHASVKTLRRSGWRNALVTCAHARLGYNQAGCSCLRPPQSERPIQHQEERPLRALITGIGGFVGSHLAEHLHALGDIELSGTLSPHGNADRLAGLGGNTSLHRGDLLDYAWVLGLVAQVRPDAIYHLAARASVGASWEDPAGTLHNNISAQLNVLRACVELGMQPRVLVVASADEYGRVRAEDLPVDEETPLRPVNPYAVSKVAQDYLGVQYHLSHGLPVVRVRPFNHSGPRQETGFVIPDFCSQIARIEAGMQEPVMRVGNLEAQRDIHDVRDTVRAYRLALELGQPGDVYNVGSGRAVAIREILDRLLALAHTPIRVEPDPARMRPSDIPRIVSDCAKLQSVTGWEPTYTLEQTLHDTLEYWRERTAQALHPPSPTTA